MSECTKRSRGEKLWLSDERITAAAPIEVECGSRIEHRLGSAIQTTDASLSAEPPGTHKVERNASSRGGDGGDCFSFDSGERVLAVK